jgi:uncharacterized protein (DUF2267 family)
MHQVKVNIIQSQTLQAQIEVLLHACVICAPQLGCHKNILSLDARLERFSQAFTDLVLVPVTISTIYVFVANAKSVSDGFLDIARSRLPRS